MSSHRLETSVLLSERSQISSSKRRAQSATFQSGDHRQHLPPRKFPSKASADKSVGPTIDEYNICYAPIRGTRTWEYKYRNILVPHWLPMASSKITDSARGPQYPSLATSGDVDDLVDTWEFSNGTVQPSRRTNNRRERPVCKSANSNVYSRPYQ